MNPKEVFHNTAYSVQIKIISKQIKYREKNRHIHKFDINGLIVFLINVGINDIQCFVFLMTLLSSEQK